MIKQAPGGICYQDSGDCLCASARHWTVSSQGKELWNSESEAISRDNIFTISRVGLSFSYCFFFNFRGTAWLQSTLFPNVRDPHSHVVRYIRCLNAYNLVFIHRLNTIFYDPSSKYYYLFVFSWLKPAGSGPKLSSPAQKRSMCDAVYGIINST